MQDRLTLSVHCSTSRAAKETATGMVMRSCATAMMTGSTRSASRSIRFVSVMALPDHQLRGKDTSVAADLLS